jgi:thymidine phosphorylase
MNGQEAQIAARALNLDGGEGSGVRGHTTERASYLAQATHEASLKPNMRVKSNTGIEGRVIGRDHGHSFEVEEHSSGLRYYIESKNLTLA